MRRYRPPWPRHPDTRRPPGRPSAPTQPSMRRQRKTARAEGCGYAHWWKTRGPKRSGLCGCAASHRRVDHSPRVLSTARQVTPGLARYLRRLAARRCIARPAARQRRHWQADSECKSSPCLLVTGGRNGFPPPTMIGSRNMPSSSTRPTSITAHGEAGAPPILTSPSLARARRRPRRPPIPRRAERCPARCRACGRTDDSQARARRTRTRSTKYALPICVLPNKPLSPITPTNEPNRTEHHTRSFMPRERAAISHRSSPTKHQSR
jgi:hypothetical protein